jgi:hypothetical protein
VGNEVALFWAVLAGFLFADNLVLVPRGGDFLRFRRRGRPRYEPGVRFQARGRDLVLLNPFDPFDRIALTARSAGPSSARELHAALRRLRRALPALNAASWIGGGYLVAVLALVVLSWQWHFAPVLAALAAVHLLAWAALLVLLIRARARLQLDAYACFVLAAEALFVPAYTINAGKRIWYRQQLELPALALGLRALKRMPDDDAAKALYAHRLHTRLDELAIDLGLDEGGAALQPWFEEARRCLKTSAPPAGS